jgi:hypothetical protein
MSAPPPADAPAAPSMVVVDQSAMPLSEQVSAARADVLNANANNTSAVLQNASGEVQTLLQTASADTENVIATGERQSQHTQAAVERSSYNQGLASSAGFFEARGLVNGSSAENRAATNLNGVEGRGASNQNFFETRNLLNNGFAANLLAAKDSQLAIAHSESKVRNDLSNLTGLISGQLSVSRESIASLVGGLALQNQVELSKYFAISERELNKQFALATLAASTNADAIQEQLAECCCEIKDAVNSSAKDTQVLVQTSDTNRVRENLAAVQLENTIYQINPSA